MRAPPIRRAVYSVWRFVVVAGTQAAVNVMRVALYAANVVVGHRMASCFDVSASYMEGAYFGTYNMWPISEGQNGPGSQSKTIRDFAHTC